MEKETPERNYPLARRNHPASAYYLAALIGAVGTIGFQNVREIQRLDHESSVFSAQRKENPSDLNSARTFIENLIQERAQRTNERKMSDEEVAQHLLGFLQNSSAGNAEKLDPNVAKAKLDNLIAAALMRGGLDAQMISSLLYAQRFFAAVIRENK